MPGALFGQGFYDPLLDDPTNQLLGEIRTNPDGCLTEILSRYYNSLYSELGGDAEFECCIDDGLPAPVEELLEDLQEYALEVITNLLIDYFLSVVSGLPRNQARRLVRDFTLRLNSVIRDNT